MRRLRQSEAHEKMYRAVLDTNVFVAGIKSQATPPGNLIDAWREKRFVLMTPHQLVSGIQEVLLRPEVLQFIKKIPNEVNDFISDLTQNTV